MRLTVPSRAQAPFHRHRLKVVCRLKSHDYHDTVTAAVLWGLQPGAGGGSALQSTTGDHAQVIVRQSQWRAEYPPQIGGYFESPEHGRLTIRAVNLVDESYFCTCVRTQRADVS